MGGGTGTGHVKSMFVVPTVRVNGENKNVIDRCEGRGVREWEAEGWGNCLHMIGTGM